MRQTVFVTGSVHMLSLELCMGWLSSLPTPVALMLCTLPQASIASVPSQLEVVLCGGSSNDATILLTVWL
jgi:hypothetical protein